MVKFVLAMPRDTAPIVGDVLRLNGINFKVELVADQPAMLHVEIDDVKMAAFNPRETIKPVASC